jgi:hypothetical protein
MVTVRVLALITRGEAEVGAWPIATDDLLTANGRFRGIAEMDRFSLFIQCDRHSDNSCEDDKELICVPDTARFECCDWRSFRGTKAWQKANYTNFDPRSQ